MDLLFNRYASPFILLDTIIESNRLCEFIDTMYEQDEETKLWQMYLQTIASPYTKKISFNEFLQSVKTPQNEKMSKDEFEAIINESQETLSNFNPNE